MFGGCFNHWKDAEVSLSLWENVTKVPDWQKTDGFSHTFQPDGIAPYARNKRNPSICFPVANCGDYDAEPDMHDPSEPSCELPTTTSYKHCTGDAVTVYQGQLWNCFHKTTSSINFSTCDRKEGWKQIYAKKVWHGKPPYTERGGAKGSIDSMEYCCGCSYLGPIWTPQVTTKYRTISTTGHIHNTGTDFSGGGPITFDWTGDASSTIIVGRYTGNMTGTCVSSSTVTGTGDPVQDARLQSLYAGTAVSVMNFASNDINALVGIACGYYNFETNAFGAPHSVSGGGVAYTITWLNGTEINSPPGQPDVLTYDLAAGTVTFDGYQSQFPLGGGGLATTHTQHFEYSISETDMSYLGQFRGTTAFDDGAYEESMTSHLSDPYTEAEVEADVEYLLSQWDMGDDTLYPWRGDFNFGYAPILCYNEKPTPTVPQPCPGILPQGNDWFYDGTVLGIPHDKHGAGYWDGTHENYSQCTDPDFGNYLQWEVTSWGAYSGGQIPQSATKWTSEHSYEFDNLKGLQGGFKYFDTVYQTLFAGKYAETLEYRQSFDYSRPHSATDRFQLTGSSACVSGSGFSGSAFTIDGTTNANIVANLQGTYTASIWGTSPNGIWLVNGSGNTITLTKQLASSSTMPNVSGELYGYGSDETDFGNGMIGRVNNGNIPAFGGRVDITKLNQSNPVTISLEEPQQGILLGDAFVIDGCSGSTSYNGNQYTFLRIGDSLTDFALQGTVSSSNVYTSGGYISVSGAPDYKWTDTQPKGDFYWVDFLYNYRDVSEYNRLVAQSASFNGALGCDGVSLCSTAGSAHSIGTKPRGHQATWGMPQEISQSISGSDCHKYSNCAPSVIYISPTTESFKNGHPLTWINGFFADNQFTSLQLKQIVQNMDDPYGLNYNPSPTCPCRPVLDNEDNPTGVYACQCGWKEDDATSEMCQARREAEPLADVTCLDYFAFRDQYEARLTVPDGAPAMKSGVCLNCLSLSQLDTSGPDPRLTSGKLCAPSLYLPWVVDIQEGVCICGTGRFDKYYIRNGVKCRSTEFDI